MKRSAKIFLGCTACAAAAGLSAFILMLSNKDTEELPEAPSVVVEEVTEAAEEIQPFTDPETYPVYDYVPSTKGMTEKAKLMLKLNKDYAGWIKINNTPIDYPVLLDPGSIPSGISLYGYEEYEANEFYLHHDFDRSYLFQGALFMDYRDVFGNDEEKQSENIVIYGHNMLNMSMFGCLRNYRDGGWYYETHPFVEMESNYKNYDYVIFGYIITSGNWYSDFCYWNMEELDTKEEFDAYIDRIHRDQLLDTGIDVRYGDKLLTMSTCYADEDNSRFIVMARRLRDGENAGDLNSVHHTDAYAAYHPEAATVPESLRTEEELQALYGNDAENEEAVE